MIIFIENLEICLFSKNNMENVIFYTIWFSHKITGNLLFAPMSRNTWVSNGILLIFRWNPQNSVNSLNFSDSQYFRKNIILVKFSEIMKILSLQFGPPKPSKYHWLRWHFPLVAKSYDSWRNFIKFTEICKNNIKSSLGLWNFMKINISESSNTHRSQEIKYFTFWVEKCEIH